ncbi:23S rRNA (uracil(1939)-C(5))-methyltransferase RlmD, partial [uncultured Sharpea sp.]|uniref:23S rRNA (uracil(1939)-C(5))-methyltransferase RlmD n=1 Tax=uncultured Sharpea sp. TaxID=1112738 RepID=UPI00258E28BF
MIKPSDEREEPICPVYKLCGGCSLMHMSYKPHTNDIIDNDFCFIQNEFSNEVTKYVKTLLEKYHIKPYDKVLKQGHIKHILTRYGVHTNEGMLALITYTKKVPHLHDLVNDVHNKFPSITTIIQNINPRHDNVILGDEVNVLYGPGYIHDTLLGNDYTISLKSFYQINPRQVEVLYTKAIELANLNKDDIVLDAYCGIGTIGLTLAKDVKKVYGIEVVEQAIEDAKENAKRNNIKNAEFICGDAGEVALEYKKQGIHFDVVIVDPPRKGCSELFLKQLIELSPERLVYISCNVATQA